MILIIGQNGQIARALKEITQSQALTLSRRECDLANPDSLENALNPLLESGRVEAVVNAAAYTQVDQAEIERDLCAAVNAISPAIIAKLCSDFNVPFIHYSTDYVYGNNGTYELTEKSPCSPLNFYGKSKLQGDQAILSLSKRSMILRTSWVYDHQGKNFVTTMMKLFKTKDKLTVVDDQVGAPTLAADIAHITLQLLDPLKRLTSPEVVHVTNNGAISWYEFAKMIFDELKNSGHTLATQSIEPILTSEWPTQATRQLNSRLSLEKLKNEFGIIPRPIEAALKECLKRIKY